MAAAAAHAPFSYSRESSMFMKRLCREMDDLRKYPNIKCLQIVEPMENNPLPQSKNSYNFVHKDIPYLKVQIDKNIIIFAFSRDYPFKSPAIYINGKSCQSCYRILHPFMLNELNRRTGMKCLCCETRICTANWSPSIRMHHLLDEYKRFKNIKKTLCAYYIFCNMNANKYNTLPVLPHEMIEKIFDYLF